MSHFSDSFESARTSFLSDCTRLGYPVESYPAADLFTDVVTIGNPHANRALLVVSGTHGPEGLAGSACQRAFLRSSLPAAIDESMRVVLVHILNVHGCANGMRATEEGVDLNRNFVDFSRQKALLHQMNPGFAPLHERLAQLALRLPPLEFRDRGLALLKAAAGEDVISVLFQGQYRVRGGIGFGGAEETAARRRLQGIVEKNLSDCTDVACIDLHTGLGDYGEGILLCAAVESDVGAALARAWYGTEVTMLNAADSTLPYRITGDVGSGVSAMLPEARVVPVTLEFGTYAVERLVQCVLAEYLLRNHRERLAEATRREMLQSIREFFYPEDTHWRGKVVTRALSVFDLAVTGLRRLPSY